MQVGKKKLVLDHLIVQKIHEDDTEDLKSLLTFGAKALFEENNEELGIRDTLAFLNKILIIVLNFFLLLFSSELNTCANILLS